MDSKVELHTDQDNDDRVLTCAVHANDRQTHSEVHVHNRGFAPDTTGLQEGELHRLVVQLEVHLHYQVLLHEHGESVTLRSLEAYSFLISLGLDAHLVIVAQKALHEVQRQCLLHVHLKVRKAF